MQRRASFRLRRPARQKLKSAPKSWMADLVGIAGFTGLVTLGLAVFYSLGLGVDSSYLSKIGFHPSQFPLEFREVILDGVIYSIIITIIVLLLLVF